MTEPGSRAGHSTDVCTPSLQRVAAIHALDIIVCQELHQPSYRKFDSVKRNQSRQCANGEVNNHSTMSTAMLQNVEQYVP